MRRPLATALWGSVLVLAVASVTRWRLGVPAGLSLALLAIAPPLIAIARGILLRPRWERAVLAADQRSEANALLISACELIAKPHPSAAAAEVVLAQAARALPQWEQRVAGARQNRPVSPSLWAPVLALITVIPLGGLEPVAEGVHQQISRPAAEESVAPISPRPALQALANDLRQAASPDQEPDRPATDQTPSPSASGALGTRRQASTRPPRTAETTGAASQGTVAPAAPTAQEKGPAESAGDGPTMARSASLATGGRDAAGTNAPPQRATPSAKTASPVLPERHVALERHGISKSVVPGAGTNLTSTRHASGAGALDTPAVPPATLPQKGAVEQSTLGPAERVLVDRYFALMQRQKADE